MTSRHSLLLSFISFCLFASDASCSSNNANPLSVEVAVVGGGFHRTFCVNFGEDMEREWAVGESGRRQRRTAVLELLLGCGVFVDPHEIQAKRRVERKGEEIALYHYPPSINVEAHADAASPLLLLVFFSPLALPPCSLASLSFCFPIHLRYHPPHGDGGYVNANVSYRAFALSEDEEAEEEGVRESNEGRGGTMKCVLCEGRERNIHLDPHNLSDWKISLSHSDSLSPLHLTPSYLSLSLPRGREDDLWLVKWGTLACAIAGAVCLTHVLIKHAPRA